MKCIGNIVFDKGSDATGLFNYCNINEINPAVPTLIIGWNKVKELYPDNSIIDWKINDNIYWTFGKREKRDKYERDVAAFKEMTKKNVLKNIKYVFFDILSSNDDEKRNFNEILINDRKKTVMLINNMLYIYVENDFNIYGINLNDISYEGKDVDHFISFIKSNKNTNFISNDIPYDLKKTFSNNIYALSYLYS